MTKNIVYVSKNLQDAELWTKTLRLNEVILRTETAKSDSTKIDATKNDIIKNNDIKFDTAEKIWYQNFLRENQLKFGFVIAPSSSPL